MRTTSIRRLALILAISIILMKSPLRAQQSGTGSHSYTIGYSNHASGAESLAFGLGSYATNQASTAFGEYTWSTSYWSTAFGIYSQATNAGATAFGFGTLASGGDATSFGWETTAEGSISTAFGRTTIASGPGSTASGYYTHAAGIASTTLGSYTTASGSYSTASGYLTTAKAVDSFVVGAVNKGTSEINNGSVNPTRPSATDPIFEVGNGTASAYYVGSGSGYNPGNNAFSTQPSDALVVYRNGDTKVSGTLSISGSNPVLVQPAGDLSMGPYTYGPTPQ